MNLSLVTNCREGLKVRLGLHPAFSFTLLFPSFRSVTVQFVVTNTVATERKRSHWLARAVLVASNSLVAHLNLGKRRVKDNVANCLRTR